MIEGLMKYTSDHYLRTAQAIAIEAGAIMRNYFKQGVEPTLKPDNSFLTVADTRINQLVIKRIQENFPGQSVMGEEASALVGGAKYTWVCDPIDGTTPFSISVPTNVFSLALVDKGGQPVVAVVYDPYLKRMYTAVRGQGAYLNDQAISVNSQTNLTDALIGISGKRSEVLDSSAFRGSVIALPFRPIVLGSAVYEAMLVASGKIMATVFPGSHAHDAVTAKLIVEEAGGKVTDLYGNEQRYDHKIKGVVVSNGQVHDQLVAMVREYLK